MKCNQSRLGFELVSLCSFPTTITITPRAHTYTKSLSCRAGSMSFPLSFSIHLYRPSHSTSSLDYILYLYRAVVDRFKSDIQLLLNRVKEFTGERRLWVRPYFSSSVLHVLFVWLEWFERWEVGNVIAAVLWNVASRICSTWLVAFLSYCSQAFFFSCA